MPKNLMIRRQWKPAVAILISTLSLSAFAAISVKPSYQAETKILFKNSAFKVAGNSVSAGTAEGSDSGDLKPLVAAQNPISTQLEVISSHPLLQQTIDKLDLKDRNGKPMSVKDIQSGLTTKIAGGSDVVQIIYKTQKKDDAARVANTVANVYLENEIQANRKEAEAVRLYMSQQLPKTQAAVDRSELALRQFKQKHNIVDLTEESKSAVTIIGNLETAISTTRAQLEDITAQGNDLRQKLNLSPQEAITVSAIGQSPIVQTTLTQLQDIDRQLAAERSRFSDNNPILVNLKEKRANLSTLLQKQIQQTIGSQAQSPSGLLKVGDLKQNLIKDFLQFEVQRIGLTKKLSSLTNSRANYQQRVNVIPKLAQEQHQLERVFEVSQVTNQTLLKKIQELQLIENKTSPSARIIARAIPPDRPESGNKPIILGFGLLAGSFFASIAIVLLELRDRSLKTIKEIQTTFGYTLLGIVPSMTKKAPPKGPQLATTTLEVAVRDTPKSLTSDMSRTIQSNLRFLASEKALKTIVITSSIANEGTSKVAANLAAAIAQVGQSVLLIDADLRVPYQHQFWKLPLKKGLSDVLAKKSKFKTIVWKVMDNLDILTAGSKPANPLSCLDSSRMKALIKEVSAAYDFVIIDTPPILIAADAIALGRMTDGILLVSRPGVIDAKNAVAAKEKLKLSDCNVLGMVVNGVIDRNESENHFISTQEYFTDEQVTELPWTEYMTQLGTTIANRSSQDTGFVSTDLSSTTPKK
jgi:capsular exopolysaccharide synthesis family protein